MPPRSKDLLRRFARLGAEERILQIREEMAGFYRQFPELKATEASPEAVPRQRGSRRMNAAQRKTASERMRRYWAKRRKETR